MMDSTLIKPTAWRCGRFYFDWALTPAPVVMGILNVTPDSFSDGGKYFDHARAIDHAFQMIEDGAKIIDLGGESTKPGAIPVSAQEEQDRVLPVLEKLQSAGVALSLDSYQAQTMQYALEIGVDILNDISGFQSEANLAVAAGAKDVGLCVMHMQNSPSNMQDQPHYENVIQEVGQFLYDKVLKLSSLGIKPERIAIDPGFCFGKSTEHNLTLLHRLAELPLSGTTLLVGLSRKKTLRKILGEQVTDLTIGSVTAALLATERGARVLRVHDVKPTIQAIQVWTAMDQEHLS
jgi:dihydropteroate synthase